MSEPTNCDGPVGRFLEPVSVARRLAFDTVVAALEQGEDFVAMTGDPGTGKTAILNMIAAQLNHPPTLVIQIEPRGAPVTVERFIDLIVGDSGDDDPSVAIEQAQCLLLCPPNRYTRTLLLVDDADMLRLNALFYLHLTSALQSGDTARLQVVFAGRPEFWSLLDHSLLRDLRDRIAVNATLSEPRSTADGAPLWANGERSDPISLPEEPGPTRVQEPHNAGAGQSLTTPILLKNSTSVDVSLRPTWRAPRYIVTSGIAASIVALCMTLASRNETPDDGRVHIARAMPEMTAGMMATAPEDGSRSAGVVIASRSFDHSAPTDASPSMATTDPGATGTAIGTAPSQPATDIPVADKSSSGSPAPTSQTVTNGRPVAGSAQTTRSLPADTATSLSELPFGAALVQADTDRPPDQSRATPTGGATTGPSTGPALSSASQPTTNDAPPAATLAATVSRSDAAAGSSSEPQPSSAVAVIPHPTPRQAPAGQSSVTPALSSTTGLAPFAPQTATKEALPGAVVGATARLPAETSGPSEAPTNAAATAAADPAPPAAPDKQVSTAPSAAATSGSPPSAPETADRAPSASGLATTANPPAGTSSPSEPASADQAELRSAPSDSGTTPSAPVPGTRPVLGDGAPGTSGAVTASSPAVVESPSEAPGSSAAVGGYQAASSMPQGGQTSFTPTAHPNTGSPASASEPVLGNMPSTATIPSAPLAGGRTSASSNSTGTTTLIPPPQPTTEIPQPRTSTTATGAAQITGTAATNVGGEATASPAAPDNSSETGTAAVSQPPLLSQPARPVPSLSMRPALTLSPALVAALLSHGDQAWRIGDVSAARLLYQRAAAAGSGAATLAMGKTYDPRFLAQIGAQGVVAYPATAADWYRRAATLGERDADELLAGLGAAAPHSLR